MAIGLTETVDKGLKKIGVTVSKPVLALIAIIFGLLVIVLPDLLELIAELYFIIQGVLLFADYLESRRQYYQRPQVTPFFLSLALPNPNF